MKIGITGPIATESIARFLSGNVGDLPDGYAGAPLLGTLIGALLAQGHEVSAYTTDSGLSLDLEQPVVAHVDRFKIFYCPSRKHSIRPNGVRLGRLVDFFRFERRFLERTITLDNPDVVHAHWAYEFALAAIATGKPHVVTCHDSPAQILKYIRNLYRLGRYFMARKAIRNARCLTTVSPYMQKELAGYAAMPIKIIPNPLDEQLFVQYVSTKREPFNSGQVHVAIVLNGWSRLKNPKPALRAFALLKQKYPDAFLHLYGADFGRGQMAEQWCRRHVVPEGVVFHGRLPYWQLIESLSHADLLLHPALEESFGMTVAEAMALGVPVIAGHKSGAVPWVLGEGGVLVDVCSPESIFQAMKRLITDRSFYRSCSENGRHRACESFSAELVAGLYYRTYLEAIQRQSSAPLTTASAPKESLVWRER